MDAGAGEVSVFFGSGPQAGAQQRNNIAGIEHTFYTLERSARQHLRVGISYSRWQSNLGFNRSLTAVSIYPELTFFPHTQSRIYRRFPEGAKPFFYTRVLGPSYISESGLGDRDQASEFAFHAEIGVGLAISARNGRSTLLKVSWRHISNGNLASPNDGIDVPLTLSVGVRY